MDYAAIKAHARTLPMLTGKPIVRKGVVIPDIFVEPERQFTISRVIPVPIWENFERRLSHGRVVSDRRIVSHKDDDGNTVYHYRIRPLTIHLNAFSWHHALRLINQPYEMVGHQLNEGLYSNLLEEVWKEAWFEGRPWRLSGKKEESKVRFQEIENKGDDGLTVDYRDEVV